MPFFVGIQHVAMQVSGLDVGWGTQLDMSIDPKTGNPTLTRMLSPGLYPYKFVVDGVWSYSLDHPTMQDGQNINNVLQVGVMTYMAAVHRAPPGAWQQPHVSVQMAKP